MYVWNSELNTLFVCFFQDASLVYISLRRFKICQQEELEMLNISPLMAVCFLLLPTIMAIFLNTRQAPWSTRWMNKLENLICIRPCKLEVLLDLNTFQSLINIFLPWQIITMERTYLTLQFINGMDSGLSSFRKYPQRAHIASLFLKIMDKTIWQ